MSPVRASVCLSVCLGRVFLLKNDGLSSQYIVRASMELSVYLSPPPSAGLKAPSSQLASAFLPSDSETQPFIQENPNILLGLGPCVFVLCVSLVWAFLRQNLAV